MAVKSGDRTRESGAPGNGPRRSGPRIVVDGVAKVNDGNRVQ